MKGLTRRELRLAVATVLILLLGLSWMVVRRNLVRLSEVRDRRNAALLEQRKQQTLMKRRPDLLRQLQLVRGQLPRHPEGDDLKPVFARQVQTLAGETGLQLTGLTPDPEEELEELSLYRSAVRGTWSGNASQIIGFLVELQRLGAVADVRDLRIRSRSGDRESLSGTFVLEFVYARVPQSQIDAEIDTSPQSPNDGVSE